LSEDFEFKMRFHRRSLSDTNPCDQKTHGHKILASIPFGQSFLSSLIASVSWPFNGVPIPKPEMGMRTIKALTPNLQHLNVCIELKDRKYRIAQKSADSEDTDQHFLRLWNSFPRRSRLQEVPATSQRAEL
jgi:hypothetical protein